MPVGPNTDPGTEIAGFRLEGLLGRGGMGAVYHARDIRLGRSVALKLLAPDLAENERFRARFLRESQLAASLDHPNVIPIYAAGEADGQLYLAMRYVQGVDLRQLLAREGPLSPERALDLLGQTADALDAAHERGLVHRDVKPANILIADRSGREHCYLVDFGLTKQTASISGLTGTGELVGTVAYTSPEQIRGEAVDERADIYSLGCVLFESLAGESPFGRETEVATMWAQVNDPPPALSAVRGELGDEIDAVFARALAKTPADRHGSCGELVAGAATALGYALTPGLSERRPRPALGTRRVSRRALIVAGATGVGAVALGTGIGVLGRGTGSSRRVRPGSVGVVDPDTRKVVAGIPVGFGSPHIASGKDSVWVLDPRGSTLTRIDPDTNAVVPPTRGVPGDGIPIGLAAGEGSLWIAMNEKEGHVLSVLEVGQELGERRGRIVLERRESGVFSELLFPVYLAVGDRAVWAFERAQGQVTRIDPATGHTKLIAEGYGAASSIAVNRDAVWLGGTTGVTKLDPSSGVELGSAYVAQAVGSRATSIAVRPGAVWFVGDASARLWRIDPGSASVIDSTPIGPSPAAIAVEDGGAVWVASSAVTRLWRLDPTTDAVEPVELGAKPRGLVSGFDRIWTSPGSSTD